MSNIFSPEIKGLARLEIDNESGILAADEFPYSLIVDTIFSASIPNFIATLSKIRILA